MERGKAALQNTPNLSNWHFRWYRALNALKAMHTMQKLTFPETVPGEYWVLTGRVPGRGKPFLIFWPNHQFPPTVCLVDDPIKCNIWWPLPSSPPLCQSLVKLLRSPSGSLIQNYSQSQPAEVLSFLRTLFNPKKCQFRGIFIFDWAATFEFYDLLVKLANGRCSI